MGAPERESTGRIQSCDMFTASTYHTLVDIMEDLIIAQRELLHLERPIMPMILLCKY